MKKYLRDILVKKLGYGSIYNSIKQIFNNSKNSLERVKLYWELHCGDTREHNLAINRINDKCRNNALDKELRKESVSIILYYNDKTNLIQCINAIKANTIHPNYHIYVIGMYDRSRIKKLVEKMQIHYIEREVGAKAINELVAQLQTDYIVLMDAAAIPMYGWLTHLLESATKENDYIGYCSKDSRRCLLTTQTAYKQAAEFLEGTSDKQYIETCINRMNQYLGSIHIVNESLMLDSNYRGMLQQKKRFHIAFLVTEATPNTLAGDFFSARGLGEALKHQFGYRISYLPKQPINEWRYIPEEVDVVIAMIETLDIRTIHIPDNVIKIAWVRGHIEEWYNNRSVELFDGILATSQLACSRLSDKIGMKKVWGRLPLAIPEGIKQQEGTRDLDVSFIGNIYHIVRPIVENLDLTQGFKFNFFGDLEDKESHPWKSYHYGKLKNSDVKEIYSRSKIVIEDIAPFNKGTVNLRVFEAAACGALVIANEDEALKELFGEAIIMYKDKQDLTQKIKFYLNNEEARIVQAYKLQQIILEKHTFEQRALAFQQILEQHIGVNLHYE